MRICCRAVKVKVLQRADLVMFTVLEQPVTNLISYYEGCVALAELLKVIGTIFTNCGTSIKV
jgi:hypothetical protein